MEKICDSTSTPEDCYNKLEKLKEIRQKTVQTEKLKLLIKEPLRKAEEEKVALEKYKKEISLLLQEKMAHVEELRAIHTDINTMESLVKDSSAERNSYLNRAQKLIEQYKPLKQEVDLLRQDIGLGHIQGLDEEELDFTNEVLSEKEHGTCIPEKNVGSETKFFLNNPQDKQLLLVAPEHKSASPPMKTCPSCQQSIHRNAPICPLCKAKSRSKNPKKPKKVTRPDE